ncbi:MAG: hypothetical protein JKY67_21040, partial [Pseudomonadales bacterium]|nr:hypothetical protein [Pseudomonadales bacterium]
LIIYSDGSVLEGLWNGGKFSGRGTFTTKKYKYTGVIRNGRPHGVGSCKQGTKKITCEFKNGKRVLAAVAVAPKVVAPKPAKAVSKPAAPKVPVVPSLAAVAPIAVSKPVSVPVSVPKQQAVATVEQKPVVSPKPAVSKEAVAKSATPNTEKQNALATPHFQFKHNWYVGGKYQIPTSSGYAKDVRRDGDLRIRTENEKFILTLTIGEYEGPGEYPLRYFAGVVSEKGVASYATSSDKVGKVRITKDDGKTISGVFEMTLFRNGNANGGDPKIVNNGSFTVMETP